jgi:hypothetical protein
MTPITMAYLPTTSRPQPGQALGPVLGDVTWRATPSHGTVPQQPRHARVLAIVAAYLHHDNAYAGNALAQDLGQLGLLRRPRGPALLGVLHERLIDGRPTNRFSQGGRTLSRIDNSHHASANMPRKMSIRKDGGSVPSSS